MHICCFIDSRLTNIRSKSKISSSQQQSITDSLNLKLSLVADAKKTTSCRTNCVSKSKSLSDNKFESNQFNASPLTLPSPTLESIQSFVHYFIHKFTHAAHHNSPKNNIWNIYMTYINARSNTQSVGTNIRCTLIWHKYQTAVSFPPTSPLAPSTNDPNTLTIVSLSLSLSVFTLRIDWTIVRRAIRHT